MCVGDRSWPPCDTPEPRAPAAGTGAHSTAPEACGSPVARSCAATGGAIQAAASQMHAARAARVARVAQSTAALSLIHLS